MSSTNKTPKLGLSQFIGEDKPKWLTDYNNDMANIDSKTVIGRFTDESGAVNYIGINIGTLTIDSGTHILTNCTGSLSISGNTARVYIVNSPNLTINGVTDSNWRNVYKDGKASYIARNTRLQIKGLANNYVLTDMQVETGDIVRISTNIGETVLSSLIRTAAIFQQSYNVTPTDKISVAFGLQNTSVVLLRYWYKDDVTNKDFAGDFGAIERITFERSM